MIEPGPTPQQLRVMAAYVRTGSQKAAAHECNLSIQTVKNHCTALYARLGVGNVLEALTKLGWVAVPGTVSATVSAKEFVRPIRRSYRHAGCDTITTLDDALSETYARWPAFYPRLFGQAWCETCRLDRPVGEFVWTADGKGVGS